MVKLVKQHVKDAITLAIGDGANDVGMIQVRTRSISNFSLQYDYNSNHTGYENYTVVIRGYRRDIQPNPLKYHRAC